MSCPDTFRKTWNKRRQKDATLTSVEARHAGNLRLTAVLLHSRLRNEAISQHRAAGKETAQMADSPLMDAGFSGFLSSKIGPSFLLAFPVLSFTARFASGTLSLPILLRISASPRPPSRATCSGRRSCMVLVPATPPTSMCDGFFRERENIPVPHHPIHRPSDAKLVNT